MNLNIYIPPNSAHPPDVIKSIVFGRVRAYYLHNTLEDHFINECTTLARNLIRCGWEWGQLLRHFNDAYWFLSKRGKSNLLNEAMRTRREKEANKASQRILVFKLPYHPRGIQRRDISKAFKDSGLKQLMPNRRFICAQTRATSLRDRVCRTALKDVPNANPSDYLATTGP